MKALLLLLAGCATPSFLEPPLNFAVDPAFGSGAPFQASSARWNLFTIKAKRIAITPGEWSVVQRDPDDGYNGVTLEGQRLIEIKPGADPYLVSIHEFGHALGLGHTATGVMDPLHATDQFTPEDLDECRRVGACQ